MAEVNIKLKLPSFKGKLPQIITGTIIGFITGIVIWAIIQVDTAGNDSTSFYQFISIFCVLFYAFSLFTILSYRRIANVPLFIGAHALYLLFVIWGLLLTKTPDMRGFLYVAYPVASLLFLSLQFMALSNKEFTSVYKYYFNFIEEFNKVFTLSIILNFFFGIVIALFIALLNTTFGSSGNLDELSQFIVLVTLTPIPFVVLALTYNFKKPINEQTELRILNLIVSAILTGGAFVIAIFLGFYLFALMLSGFGPILDTGDTSATFLGMIASCLTLLYLSSQFVGKGMNRTLNVVLVGLHSTLVLECFIMLCVAIYALGVRIDAHGLTLNRVIGILAMISISIILVKYCLILLTSIVPVANIGRYAAGLRFTIFTSILLTFVLTILTPMAIDFEAISLKLNYASVDGKQGLSTSLDRRLYSDSGIKSVNYLEKKYEKESDLKMKADIIITLHSIRKDITYSNDDSTEQAATEVLRNIANKEDNTYLVSLAEWNLEETQYGRYNFVNDGKCERLVAELLDLDQLKYQNDLTKFCNVRGYAL